MTIAEMPRAKSNSKPHAAAKIRNGLAELRIKPGDHVTTERVAMAVHITPELAQDWMDRFADPQKRHIRPAKVADYSEKMLHGDWLEMAKTIEFIASGDGLTHLSDGHHRLKAIVASGVPLWFEVHFGAPPQARRIEGVRLTRSPADMLRMEGCPGYYSEVSSGVRNAMLFDQTVGTDIRWKASSVDIPDAEDIVLYWLEKPTMWNDIVPVTKGLISSWPVGMAQGAITAFVYHAERLHPGKGVEFVKIAAAGQGPIDGRNRTCLSIFLQMLRVRPAIEMSRRGGTQLDWNRYTMAVLIRAFNVWIVGKTSFLRPEWSTSKAFPLDKIK